MLKIKRHPQKKSFRLTLLAPAMFLLVLGVATILSPGHASAEALCLVNTAPDQARATDIHTCSAAIANQYPGKPQLAPGSFSDGHCYSVTINSSGNTMKEVDCGSNPFDKFAAAVGAPAGSDQVVHTCTDESAAANQTTNCVNPRDCASPSGEGCMATQYISWIINALSAVVGIIVIINIIVGGIQYTTAGGDPQRVAAAKQRVANAILALVAFLFLFAFLQWIVPGGLL